MICVSLMPRSTDEALRHLARLAQSPILSAAKGGDRIIP